MLRITEVKPLIKIPESGDENSIIDEFDRSDNKIDEGKFIAKKNQNLAKLKNLIQLDFLSPKLD